MSDKPQRPRRAVLYVPASNAKALAKLASLECDAVIFDLEDAVAPDDKEAARDALRVHFRANKQSSQERIIRINGLDTPWGSEDLLAARGCRPDAILLPKVGTPQDVLDAVDALAETDAPPTLRLWAMVETARGLLNLPEIAELARHRAARLDCLVAGTNDLAKETGTRLEPGRTLMIPWLMQMVLAARAGGIDVIDGVSNQFSDLDAFGAECRQGASMGFDGKTLIHPAQIAPALTAFTPSADEIAKAKAICDAFALPQNEGKGVIALGGTMVERLHLDQANRLLARAGH
jgi:citrate lyase subunit beta / citryl-CoA lyase